jgi:hypothetical protein
MLIFTIQIAHIGTVIGSIVMAKVHIIVHLDI